MMNKKILYPLGLTLGLFLTQNAWAQTVTIRVTEGRVNEQAKQNIEQQSSLLLSSFNESIIEDGKKMKDKLRNALPTRSQSYKELSASIMEMWEQSPVNCYMVQLERPVLTLYTNNVYQMRNIPVNILATEGQDAFQELVLSFDSEGNLSEMNFALEKANNLKVIPEGITGDDLSHRQIIQGFLELYRSAYFREDYSLIKLLLSEDCLLLQGSDLRKHTNDRTTELLRSELGKDGYKQMTQRKKEYLSKLHQAFGKEQLITLHLDDVTVTKTNRRHLYTVTLRQSWSAAGNSDTSSLVLNFNFSDPLNPIIEVQSFS